MVVKTINIKHRRKYSQFSIKFSRKNIIAVKFFAKSIMLSHTSILIFLLLLITMMNCVVDNDELFRKKIISELPKKADFEYYLTALEKIVDFCTRHKIYVDLNLEFGLFLIDVNMEELFHQKRKDMAIRIRYRMDSLFDKNKVLTDYFHNMMHENENDTKIAQDIQMANLFYNRTTWPRPSDEFNTELLIKTKFHSQEQLQKMYGEWHIYYKYVLDLSKYKPSPKQSDECVAYLATHNQEFKLVCEIPDSCKRLLHEGNPYGYGLTHRILFMISARFSRQCIVFNQEADQFKTDVYCLMCFNEAEYIASNNFELPDLMLEQIALCALFGHAQFLRNTWLKSLLLYQTVEGCFSENLATGRFDESLMRERENDKWKMDHPRMMNGQCNGHLTAVATMALTNVIRFIMETHF